MNKIEIEVPKEIRYISEWDDFNTDLLKGHCILNKTITGCGFTHFCLTNNQPVILCSPRKFLLENKFEQLGSDYNLFLVINNGERSLDVDGGLLEKTVGKELKKVNKVEDDFTIISDLKSKLYTYLVNSAISHQAPKILVTYDSLRYVLDVVGTDLVNYSIIVDEFQNIFMDSYFKAETELNFVEDLQSCPNVTYLSATPFMEEYLNELDEFKNLPYYELKWDPSCLRTININYKKTSSISKEVDKIINSYRNLNFPVKIDLNKKIHESKEVVFYVNSVRSICSIIKRNNLNISEVNIICANTKSNQDTLKKIGHSIGKAPLIGEPHKMFTFCTRTTYVGADFYSTSAYSVIVSDCKINTLTTDIRMDFPQIMGRQRLKENVFRDECTFIFSLADTSVTIEQFNEISEKKLNKSKLDLRNYSLVSQNFDQRGQDAVLNLLSDIRTRINVYKYNEDYTGISVKEGKPVINKLVYLSEKRAFELRSNVYRDVFSVYDEFRSISENISIESNYNISHAIEDAQRTYLSLGRFVDKMRTVCTLLLDPEVIGHVSISDLPWVERDLKNYIYYLGPKKIRALGYEELKLNAELENSLSSDQIREKFTLNFIIGEKYSLKYIKETLRRIYQGLGLSKTPKATDLEEYFVIKLIKIYDPLTKKQSSGYLIQSLK